MMSSLCATEDAEKMLQSDVVTVVHIDIDARWQRAQGWGKHPSSSIDPRKDCEVPLARCSVEPSLMNELAYLRCQEGSV